MTEERLEEFESENSLLKREVEELKKRMEEEMAQQKLTTDKQEMEITQ